MAQNYILLPSFTDFLALALPPLENIPDVPPGPRPPIRKPKAPALTRDQRRDVQLLRSLGWQYKAIRYHTSFEIRQIEYALKQPATPKKSTGRPPLLSHAQVEELIEFVYASKKNRRMSYKQLALALNFGVKEFAIRTALQHEGFYRRLAIRKPPILEKNR